MGHRRKSLLWLRLCRVRRVSVRRIIHHFDHIPGEAVNNSAFLFATHLAAVLYDETHVVNNSLPFLSAKPPRRGRMAIAALQLATWAVAWAFNCQRPGGSSRLPELNQLYISGQLMSIAPQQIVAAAERPTTGCGRSRRKFSVASV